MSVYERTDGNHQRARTDTGVERSTSRDARDGYGGHPLGGERAARVAAAGGVSTGGCCRRGPREPWPSAGAHLDGGAAGAGADLGADHLPGLQRYPSGGTAGGTRGVIPLPGDLAALAAGGGLEEPTETAGAHAPQPPGAGASSRAP